MKLWPLLQFSYTHVTESDAKPIVFSVIPHLNDPITWCKENNIDIVGESGCSFPLSPIFFNIHVSLVRVLYN